MKLRRIPVFLVLPSILLLPSHGEAAASPSGDLSLLQTASVRLGHDSRANTLHWLKSQPPIAEAALGRDGGTVTIQFRDGLQADILPRLSHTVRVTVPALSARLRAHLPGAARAVVWEPFATELGLGSQAGAPEVSALQRAGFSVDQAYDAQVTVATMSTLPQYNVVYMHTHSGVDSSGHGVLATGEQVNGDPSVAPLMADGSVVVVGVAGSSNNYYAITSTFIRSHMGQLPANSLLFMNGCSLLQSQEFWNALQARGAGVLVSWTQDATAQDDFLSGAAFFNQMGQGQLVHDALQSLYAAGYGKSTYQNQVATLGSLGNDGITLASAANGQTATAVPTVTRTPFPTATPRSTSTPQPTRTPRPTSTMQPTRTPRPTASPTPPPTATDTPQPTATHTPEPTATPVTASGHIVSATVKPGHAQTINVSSLPNIGIRYHVAFPNGDSMSGTVTTDSTGVARIRFVQPASKVTRKHNHATVTVTPDVGGTSLSWSQKYAIGFAAIDVSVQPRIETVGKRATLWVHTASRTTVRFTVRKGTRVRKTLHARTGAHGWASVRYLVPGALRGAHLVVRVDAKRGKKDVHTASSLTVSG